MAQNKTPSRRKVKAAPRQFATKRERRHEHHITDPGTPYGRCVGQQYTQFPWGSTTKYKHVTKGPRSITAGDGMRYRHMLEALYARAR